MASAGPVRGAMTEVANRSVQRLPDPGEPDQDPGAQGLDQSL